MNDPTSLLFGLESFRVVDVVRVADRMVQVVIETIERQGVCPDCGMASSRVKDRPLVRIRDLPVADQRVVLWWRKRRLACLEPACPRASFAQVSGGRASRRRPGRIDGHDLQQPRRPVRAQANDAGCVLVLRTALARCQACSSTPSPGTSASRPGSSTSGRPTSTTA